VNEANSFVLSLIHAWKVMGSLLDVALLLGVEPRQVYRWIADLERLPTARLCELENRLRPILTAARLPG
jgi:DNA-binding transcriptional regulator YdaS (Cro superfamily)